MTKYKQERLRLLIDDFHRDRIKPELYRAAASIEHGGFDVVDYPHKGNYFVSYCTPIVYVKKFIKPLIKDYDTHLYRYYDMFKRALDGVRKKWCDVIGGDDDEPTLMRRCDLLLSVYYTLLSAVDEHQLGLLGRLGDINKNGDGEMEFLSTTDDRLIAETDVKVFTLLHKTVVTRAYDPKSLDNSRWMVRWYLRLIPECDQEPIWLRGADKQRLMIVYRMLIEEAKLCDLPPDSLKKIKRLKHPYETDLDEITCTQQCGVLDVMHRIMLRCEGDNRPVLDSRSGLLMALYRQSPYYYETEERFNPPTTLFGSEIKMFADDERLMAKMRDVQLRTGYIRACALRKYIYSGDEGLIKTSIYSPLRIDKTKPPQARHIVPNGPEFVEQNLLLTQNYVEDLQLSLLL